MRATIHRGANEIGGSCVELEHDGFRLLIDLGLPLDSTLAAPPALPAVAGLSEYDPSLLGVVISHGHPDHWGLACDLPGNPPIYIGETTARILREAAFFTPMGADFRPAGFLRHRKPMQIGPFCVTPMRVDHSAFDAYAVLVEASGRRLLYSGDLRIHGRRGALTEELISDPPRAVDVFMLEGTHVRPEQSPERRGLTEAEVEATVTQVCRKTGLVLAAYSPQNVDRLVTIYRAARAAGRAFVLDLYAAAIAAVAEDPELPLPGEDDVLVYVPQAQRIKVKRAGAFDRVNGLRGSRIFPEQLASRADELVLTFRPSMGRELERLGCLNGAHLLWSMWAGYLDDARRGNVRAWAGEHAIELNLAHASGHASVSDLQRLAAAIGATRVVPIHTATPERFPALFDRVHGISDGEWVEV